MEFASLGSGSKGNATLVRTENQLVLIDCGFSLQETRQRMHRLGVDIGDLTGILVTHEHGDHARGIGVVSRQAGVPVYLTHGTYRSCRALGKISPRWITPGKQFLMGDLNVTPVTVPHDAAEPCQFVFQSSAGCRLGLVTDVGHVTPYMETMYAGCHALMLECNHDRDMLVNGPYPPSLKARVGGPYGHLSNDQSGQLLAAVNHAGLQMVCLTHLSEQNNHPELAEKSVSLIVGQQTRLHCISQDQGLDWQKIESGNQHAKR